MPTIESDRIAGDHQEYAGLLGIPIGERSPFVKNELPSELDPEDIDILQISPNESESAQAG